MIVAVDGPAGSGKGTVTKRIEKESDLNPFDEEQLQKVVNRIHIMSEEQNKAASLFKK